MAKINNKLIYGLEDLPSLLDYLIGSKDKNGKTKNFALQSIVNLINGVNGKNVIQYKFFNETTPDIDYTTPGAFFTNNNQTDVNNFSSLLFNKKTLGNYDLSILFDFLSGVGDLFIGIDNPSNPNNFFTLKVTSISNQGNYFIFNVEPYNSLYIGELSHESIYSLYWETKEWISQIDDINSDLDSKLDHGGYLGTGQDLKNEINAVVTDLADNYYTKPEVDGKISSVYRFRGNVANFASLPTSGLTIGDVYNALDTDINWAWTGTVWDNLGGTSDVSGKEDKSNKQNSLAPDGTGQKYLGIDGAIVAFNTKLDKGTYTGNAGDLKAAIDAIFIPDQLISAVPPTRSVNTFTYPANQYTVLISKTIRTNPSNFVTTIGVAATDYKRVDLIYFKSDNTLDKIIGIESLTIAIRPDLPSNSVGISFINVFGNTIETPTPVTKEISIQDGQGLEKFKINDYLRFENVSFNFNQKMISIDSLVPLSVFFDATNGNDFTAAIENSKKPFRTIEALFNALPVTNGETYNIYIVNGNVLFNRKIVPRNINWISYKGANLDFTNVLENDGITNATKCFTESVVQSIWTFQNSNISIICNYVGRKAFTTNTDRVLFKGTINVHNWKSVAEASYAPVHFLYKDSDIIIITLYDSAQDNTIFGLASTVSIRVINYSVQYGRAFVREPHLGLRLTIDNVNQIGTGTVNVLLTTVQYKLPYLKISKININGSFTPNASEVFYDRLIVNSSCNIVFNGSDIISGEIVSSNYMFSDYFSKPSIFKNFTGKIGRNVLSEQGQLTFEDCNIEVMDTLIQRYLQHNVENCIRFKGYNVINQIDKTKDLVNCTAYQRPEIKPTTIYLEVLNSNVDTYGRYTSYIKTTSTFKEKLKEVVIRSKTDILDRVLDSFTTYIIDGKITLLTGEYIQIPSGGLTIAGYGFDVSAISKNVTNQSIFISPSGNSGNFVSRDIMYSPGVGTVFNITDSDGSHAIELNDVNFKGITGSSLGVINGYRQFTGTTCGFYGLSDGLTLEGNWSGFKLTNSNIIGFGGSGTLFKKGVSTLFSNRFYIDLNIQIATGSKICDFEESNFSNNKSLQVVNCYTKVNGFIDDTTTSLTFPNITPYSSKAYFVNNIGIKNSNNMPYGISTGNMQTYANDTDAAAGGIVQVGDTYIETSSGYFKKRLT